MNRSIARPMVPRLRHLLAEVVLAPVHLYRRVISPLKATPTCRYLPTCSEYAVEAVRTRGVLAGVGLAAWRVLRCNPLCRSGHDPVPPRRGRRSGHRAGDGHAHEGRT